VRSPSGNDQQVRGAAPIRRKETTTEVFHTSADTMMFEILKGLRRKGATYLQGISTLISRKFNRRG